MRNELDGHLPVLQWYWACCVWHVGHVYPAAQIIVRKTVQFNRNDEVVSDLQINVLQDQ